MQTKGIVARLINECLPKMHAARRSALSDVCRSAVNGSWLTLSRLACGTDRQTALRHRVKCVDRLLANVDLHQERRGIYRALAERWLADLPQLLIVVDWTPLSGDLQWHGLRASVVVDGRSVTLYEEVHPRHLLANRRVHQHFLAHLARLLPPSQGRPIIMTDAGFRTTWFQMLASLGWYWIGRIRNRDFVRWESGPWFAAKSLYARASETPLDLGLHESVRSNPIAARLVLAARPRKGRVRRYRSGKVANNSPMKKIAQRYREPWLLSCAPGLSHLEAAAIVGLYAQRMRIEQGFRDTKNPALGMGLQHSRSRSQRRFEILLLIAHVAGLVKRLIGEAAKACGIQRLLVSTNRCDRPEISALTLASRVIDHPALMRSIRSLRPAWTRLRSQVSASTQCPVAPS